MEQEENKSNSITLNIYGKEFSLSFKNIFLLFILPVALSFIANVLYDNFKHNDLHDDFSTLESRINSLEISMTNFEERLEKLEKNENHTVINNIISKNLRPAKDGIIEIQGSVEVACLLAKPSWNKSEILAINKETNDTYTAEDLKNEKILLPYKTGDQEVLFYGQYDDGYNWDKDCTINVYENDELILISETLYKNGTPLSSKLIYPYETKEKTNVWCITNRKYDKKFNNIDETWNYFKINEYPKTFDFENAEINDLLYVSQLENEIKNSSSLEGYYRDKKVKDIKTNEEKIVSYMIKNNEDGFIRTLYIGEFENGDFQDQTGNAKEIVFDETVNKYFYYTGTFTKGRRDSDNNLEYKTQDEINKIIKPYKFNCELNWYDTTKGTD